MSNLQSLLAIFLYFVISFIIAQVMQIINYLLSKSVIYCCILYLCYYIGLMQLPFCHSYSLVCILCIGLILPIPTFNSFLGGKLFTCVPNWYPLSKHSIIFKFPLRQHVCSFHLRLFVAYACILL